jgi:hypothetical protein
VPLHCCEEVHGLDKRWRDREQLHGQHKHNPIPLNVGKGVVAVEEEASPQPDDFNENCVLDYWVGSFLDVVEHFVPSIIHQREQQEATYHED